MMKVNEASVIGIRHKTPATRTLTLQ